LSKLKPTLGCKADDDNDEEEEEEEEEECFPVTSHGGSEGT
jgi:hypothetical protein